VFPLACVNIKCITGFQFKYLLARFDDNTIGLTGGLNESISAYYNDANTWQPAGSMSASANIPSTGVPLLATTTALSGQSDDLYTYDVNIGLVPDSTATPRPGVPEEVPITKPELPTPPTIGDEIVLPGGGKVKVVRGWRKA